MTTNFLQFTKESFLHKLDNAQVRMSNDNDGVVESSLLRDKKGWETTQFYNYEQLAQTGGFTNTLPVVAVDCGVTNEDIYTIDNHVGMYGVMIPTNPKHINLNLYNKIVQYNYTNKFAMSTTLLTWVALGIPLPPTIQGKMILIALDGGHKGYYSSFKKQYIENLKQLGIEGELLPILERFTLKDFEKLLVTYMGAGKDKVILDKDGYLKVNDEMYKVYDLMSKHLGFPIILPQGQFTVIEEYKSQVEDIDKMGNLFKRDDVVTWAYISSKKVSYSKIKLEAGT